MGIIMVFTSNMFLPWLLTDTRSFESAQGFICVIPNVKIAVLLFICLEEGNIPYYPLFPILTLKPRCCFRSGARGRVASTLWYVAEQSLEMREKEYLTKFSFGAKFSFAPLEEAFGNQCLFFH